MFHPWALIAGSTRSRPWAEYMSRQTWDCGVSLALALLALNPMVAIGPRTRAHSGRQSANAYRDKHGCMRRGRSNNLVGPGHLAMIQRLTAFPQLILYMSAGSPACSRPWGRWGRCAPAGRAWRSGNRLHARAISSGRVGGFPPCALLRGTPIAPEHWAQSFRVTNSWVPRDGWVWGGWRSWLALCLAEGSRLHNLYSTFRA